MWGTRQCWRGWSLKAGYSPPGSFCRNVRRKRTKRIKSATRHCHTSLFSWAGFSAAGQSGSFALRRGLSYREHNSRPLGRETPRTSFARDSKGLQRNWTRLGLELGRGWDLRREACHPSSPGRILAGLLARPGMAGGPRFSRFAGYAAMRLYRSLGERAAGRVGSRRLHDGQHDDPGSGLRWRRSSRLP